MTRLMDHPKGALAELNEEITIREIEKKDLEGLCRLYEELLEEPHDIASMEKGFAAVDNDPNNHVIVACIGDEVAGTMQYTVIPSLACDNRPHVAVEYVIVGSEHRRKGIARKMFRYAFDDMESTGPVCILLVSGAGRKEAHILYKEIGFDDDVLGFRRSYI